MTDALNSSVSNRMSVISSTFVSTASECSSLQRLNNINQRNTTLCTGPRISAICEAVTDAMWHSIFHLPFPHPRSGRRIALAVRDNLGLPSDFMSAALAVRDNLVCMPSRRLGHALHLILVPSRRLGHVLRFILDYYLQVFKSVLLTYYLLLRILACRRSMDCTRRTWRTRVVVVVVVVVVAVVSTVLK